MSSLPLPAAAFVGGLVSFLSPCVLPLVPGYVSLVSGTGVEELRHSGASSRRSVAMHSLLFVLGFSVVFVALGAIASSVGQLLGQHLSLLTRVAGSIVVILGLHMTGLVPIRYLDVDRRAHTIGRAGSAGGAFLIGFSFAFGWTPCVGPVLATVLTMAASKATVNQGAALLAMYSAGLAVPFFLTSLAIEPFVRFHTRFRRHLRALEVVSGTLLIVIGALIFTGHFLLLNGWMNNLSVFRLMAERFL